MTGRLKSERRQAGLEEELDSVTCSSALYKIFVFHVPVNTCLVSMYELTAYIQCLV